MPYLPTYVLLFVGMVLLLSVAVRTLVVLHRFGAARTQLSRYLGESSGRLRVRSAALRVGIAQRRPSGPATRRITTGAPASAETRGTIPYLGS